jgi:hypothetical protein
MSFFKTLDSFLLSEDRKEELRAAQILMARLSRGNILAQQGKVTAEDELLAASKAADKAMRSLERMNSKF